MIGKKKGSYYIFIKKENNEKDVDLVSGWIKNGVGYHKLDNGYWRITDVETGKAISLNGFKTLDQAEEAALSYEMLVAERKNNSETIINDIILFKELIKQKEV